MIPISDCQSSVKTKLRTIYLQGDNVPLNDILLVKHYQWQSRNWRRPGLKTAPVMKYCLKTYSLARMPLPNASALINIATFVFEVNK